MIVYIFGFIIVLLLALLFLLRLAAIKEFERISASWKNTCDERWKTILALESSLTAAQERVKTANHENSVLKNINGQLSAKLAASFSKRDSLLSDKTPLPNSSSSSSSSLSNVGGGGGNGLDCVICLETGAMTCFIPCGHISTCVSCAKCMTPPVCPICRCANGRFYAVYDARNNDHEDDNDKKEVQMHEDEVDKRKGMIRRFLDRIHSKNKGK